jgi:hypothetical protein
METLINEVTLYVLGIIIITCMPLTLIISWITYLVRRNSENPIQLKNILTATVIGIIVIIADCCYLRVLLGEN